MTQMMLIAPSVWNQEDTVSAEFKIPKLNCPQEVQFFMEPFDNPHFSCSITYDDSKEKIVIPFMVLRYLYDYDSSKNLYTIPIQWNFQRCCTIYLTTHIHAKCEDWSKTRSIMCNIGNCQDTSSEMEKISGFWESTRFKLEPKQLIRLSGKIGKKEECEQVIIVFSECVTIQDLYGSKSGYVLELRKITSGVYEGFVTCQELNGYFKVFTRGSKPIEVEVECKRKVVMLFEDPHNTYEFKETVVESNAFSIPEWTGETLVYRDFEKIFDIGKHVTHVYFSTILNDIRKTQVACLLGLSFDSLNVFIFDNKEKHHICVALSGLFSFDL
jgi:hypothetical protein